MPNVCKDLGAIARSTRRKEGIGKGGGSREGEKKDGREEGRKRVQRESIGKEADQVFVLTQALTICSFWQTTELPKVEVSLSPDEHRYSINSLRTNYDYFTKIT